MGRTSRTNGLLIKMIKSQKDVYKEWDYGEFNDYKKKLIIKEVPLDDFQIFLDLGSGYGEFSKHVPKNCLYIGLEFTETQIKKANKLGITVIYADLTEAFPAADNSIDIILASEILEHIFDTDHFLQECHRILKPGGRLIITTPNVCDLSGRIRCVLGYRPPNIEHRASNRYAGHIRAFTIHDLKELLRDNKLKLIKHTGYEFYLPFKITCNTKYFGWLARICTKLMPTLSTGLLLVCTKVKNE